jgi:hypothetical protein
MTSKTLIVALAMLLTATSASLAWTQRTTTRSHRGVYNSAMSHHGHYYNSTRLYRRRSNAGPRMDAGRESGFRY